MTYFINVGYTFRLNTNISPNGAIILSSSMPCHQLIRRNIDRNYQYMHRRFFDPQLYLAGLDANETPKPCFNLATYPWFSVCLPEFDSSEISQSDFKKEQIEIISQIWTGQIPTGEDCISDSVAKCIQLQIKLGCEGIILPSPLTDEPTSDYSTELEWLDAGIHYIQENHIEKPIFATIAISDICLRFQDLNQNQLLNIIIDSISAREINGIYLVFEQRTERDETKYLGNTRVISAALEIIHKFKIENRLSVIVNFFGPFGIVLSAIGADIWATDWYKSLSRFRLADKMGTGLTYPNYWSSKLATDINLKNDFDVISQNAIFPNLIDQTEACEGLLRAKRSGVSVNDVPAWQYRPNNRTASMDHYRLSIFRMDQQLFNLTSIQKLDYIQEWLNNAALLSSQVRQIIGRNGATKIDHINAWKDAFSTYRSSHRI